MLPTPKMAKNCPASWARMKGDARVRHCTHCDRKVYNLSEMTTEEASAFLIEHEGRNCIRFYQRSDGMMMTKDCGVVERSFVRVKAVAVAVLGLFGLATSQTSFAGAPANPESLLKSRMRRIHSLSEQIREEKDPELRAILLDMRRKEAEEAKGLARRILDKG